MTYNTEIKNEDAVPIPYMVMEDGKMIELSQLFNGSPIRANLSRVRVVAGAIYAETDKQDFAYVFNPKYSIGLVIQSV